MPLHERPDFRALIEQTAAPLGKGMMGAAIVEKDYWITEALRAIAAREFPNVIFKGGTSLTKAWRLTARLSEDIDLLVDPAGLSRTQRDTCMKAIATAVQDQLGLPMKRRTYSEGKHLTADLTYQTALGQPLLRPSILLEIGTRGGPEPSRMCSVDSLMSRALGGRRGFSHVTVSSVPGADTPLPADVRREALRRSSGSCSGGFR